jgi:hypothetical protein
MVKHIPLYCLALIFLFGCDKAQVTPEDEAYAANYVLNKVEKEAPQVHTSQGMVSEHQPSLLRLPPFTDDTLTNIRSITFYKKTLSEITRTGQVEEKSYYSVKSLDTEMEFSPKFYGIYYTFDPNDPSVFSATTDPNLVKSGLTMKADVQKNGIVLTKYVVALKNKTRYVGKVDENFFDAANLYKLKAGDTLITMKYRIYLKQSR